MGQGTVNVGQGTVPCPTTKTAIEPHHQGGRGTGDGSLSHDEKPN